MVKYKGKELDAMHGLNWYDYSARYYDPAEMRFTTIDPLAEKYYSWSPYAYVANNPMKFIDPTGMEFWLAEYGEDGKITKMLYTPGMEYKGNNEFFKNSINLLNQMNSVEIGNIVLTSLSSSEGMYYYTNVEASGNSQAGTIPSEEGTYFAMGNDLTLEDVSHEMFHGYQIEQGLGGKSIANEVEANVFADAVAQSYEMSGNPLKVAETSAGLVNNSIWSDPYANLMYGSAISKLVGREDYSLLNFSVAVSSFKRGARLNQRGGYNNYPLYLERQKGRSSLSPLYPLIRIK